MRLEPRRLIFPFVMAEVVMARPRGHNEVIIFESQVPSDHLAAFHLDVFDFVKKNGDILLVSQNAPERLSNIGRGQFARGHLVKKRLKKMMVALIDQDNLNGSVGQSFRSTEAAKSPSDDYNHR